MKKKKRRKNSNWQFWAIISLPVIYAIVFAYIPMGGIIIGFKDYSIRKGILGSNWVGLKYFKQFLTSTNSLLVIKNTLILGIYTLLTFPVPIILAIGINEMRCKWYKKTVQMITYAPYFISVVVLVGMMMQMMDLRSGIINLLLGRIGVGPVNFFGNPKVFRSLYVWSGIWQTAGYSSIIYVAALAGVPQELEEAAIVDGASRFQRICHVDFPSILPTIIIMLIFSFGNIITIGMDKIYLMQNSMNRSVSDVFDTYIYTKGVVNGNYSLATAAGMFKSVVSMIMVLGANRLAKAFGESGFY